MNESYSNLDQLHEGLTRLERLLNLVKKELDKSLIANFEEVKTRRATLGETPQEALSHVLSDAIHSVAECQETDMERFLKSALDELKDSIKLVEELRKEQH